MNKGQVGRIILAKVLSLPLRKYQNKLVDRQVRQLDSGWKFILVVAGMIFSR